LVKSDLECDFCFKKVESAKDLRKVKNMKSWKCKECQERDRRPKMSWYMPIELQECTFEQGGKLIGVKAPNGQFIALNKVLHEFTKPHMKCLEFVAHIQDHISKEPNLKGQSVICKICNKTIDQIWDESQTKRNGG